MGAASSVNAIGVFSFGPPKLLGQNPASVDKFLYVPKLFTVRTSIILASLSTRVVIAQYRSTPWQWMSIQYRVKCRQIASAISIWPNMLHVHVFGQICFTFRNHCLGVCEIYVIYSGIEVIQNVIFRTESSSSSIPRPRRSLACTNRRFNQHHSPLGFPCVHFRRSESHVESFMFSIHIFLNIPRLLFPSSAESESESEIFIRSFQTQETSAKTISGRCRRGGHLHLATTPSRPCCVWRGVHTTIQVASFSLLCTGLVVAVFHVIVMYTYSLFLCSLYEIFKIRRHLG